MKEDALENVKKQQLILNALSKVEEKLGRLEITQHPHIIYQTIPVARGRIFSDAGDGVKSRRRSYSGSTASRRSHERNLNRQHCSSQEPFEQRLCKSVKKYYDRTKRVSLEYRNVERYCVN